MLDQYHSRLYIYSLYLPLRRSCVAHTRQQWQLVICIVCSSSTTTSAIAQVQGSQVLPTHPMRQCLPGTCTARSHAAARKGSLFPHAVAVVAGCWHSTKSPHAAPKMQVVSACQWLWEVEVLSSSNTLCRSGAEQPGKVGVSAAVGQFLLLWVSLGCGSTTRAHCFCTQKLNRFCCAGCGHKLSCCDACCCRTCRLALQQQQ